MSLVSVRYTLIHLRIAEVEEVETKNNNHNNHNSFAQQRTSQRARQSRNLPTVLFEALVVVVLIITSSLPPITATPPQVGLWSSIDIVDLSFEVIISEIWGRKENKWIPLPLMERRKTMIP